jgi:hypothetical protein
MEAMYQQWDSVSLDKPYEDLIIALCVLVLRYLDRAVDLRPAAFSSSSLKDLESLLTQISKADID